MWHLEVRDSHFSRERQLRWRECYREEQYRVAEEARSNQTRLGSGDSALGCRFAGRNCSRVKLSPQVPQLHCTGAVGMVLGER